MIRPIYQTIIDPERGDCERACVASLLGLPIGDVPNFADPEVRCRFDMWLPEWLRARGYGVIEPKTASGADGYSWLGLERLVAIATVPSQRFPGGKHAILVGWRAHPVHDGALECYVVHDPNPGNAPYEHVERVTERLRWVVPHMVAP